jgi:hypothetical protein
VQFILAPVHTTDNALDAQLALYCSARAYVIRETLASQSQLCHLPDFKCPYLNTMLGTRDELLSSFLSAV